MKIELDEDILRELVREYQDYEEDESYFYHLANYLIKELREQHPELFKK